MIDEANCAVLITAITTAMKITSDPRWTALKALITDAAIKKDVVELEGLAKVPLATVKEECNWPGSNKPARLGFRMLKDKSIDAAKLYFTPWDPKLPAVA